MDARARIAGQQRLDGMHRKDSPSQASIMKTTTSRRTFLKHTAAASAVASIGFPAIQAAESPGDKLLVGCMGLGRGLDHVRAILEISNVEIAYLCDIDDQRLERAAKVVDAKQERKPKGVKDFRHVL